VNVLLPLGDFLIHVAICIDFNLIPIRITISVLLHHLIHFRYVLSVSFSGQGCQLLFPNADVHDLNNTILVIGNRVLKLSLSLISMRIIMIIIIIIIETLNLMIPYAY